MAVEQFGGNRFEESGGNEKSETVGRTFETEGGPVEVRCKELAPRETVSGENPEKRERREKLAKAVIFLSGWSMDAESESIRDLSQSFADYAAEPAYIISTRSINPPGPDALYYEADAVRQLIEEKHLSDVVISGQSQGGDKAIDLVNLLQEKNRDTVVKGLVLIDSVGLYGQGKGELTRKFSKDFLVNTPRGVLKSIKSHKPFLRQSLQAATDVVFEIIREMKRSLGGYPQRLSMEIENMAKFNRRIENVKAPVVLVHGAEDPVSDPRKIAPVEKPSEREAYLKANIFKSSPYVRMVVAEKAGHHGLALFRPESVAKASLYMLERFYRSRRT